MNFSRQDHLRQRFFLRRCKRVEVSETVFHGSPVEGLAKIHRDKKIEPQFHGTLAGNWFCVSTNDNMLRDFSENEGITGMIFNPPEPLQCLQLDWLHFALLASEGDNFQINWLEHYPGEDDLAYRLGYESFQHHGLHIDEHDFRKMLPSWVDGLILPWGLDYPTGREEAEIALTKKGCATVWASLDQIVINGDWQEPAEAWPKINRLNSRNQQKKAA